MFPEGRALEFLIVAIVALVVVGPKDLPVLLRKLGQFMAKLRGMAAEFRASFDEMARQSELDELRKEVEALRRGQLADQAAQASGHADVTQALDDIHQGLTGAGVQLHPPMGYQYAEAASEPAPATTIAVAEPAPKTARKTAAKAKPLAKAPARNGEGKATGKTAAPRKTATAKKPAAKAPSRSKTSGGSAT